MFVTLHNADDNGAPYAVNVDRVENVQQRSNGTHLVVRYLDSTYTLHVTEDFDDVVTALNQF